MIMIGNYQKRESEEREFTKGQFGQKSDFSKIRYVKVDVYQFFIKIYYFFPNIRTTSKLFRPKNGKNLQVLIHQCKFFACKIFCLHCVSIDFVSHHQSFMNGYNKTRVNIRSHNRSRECKTTSIHRCRVKNILHCESRGGRQKNLELAALACKKNLHQWINAYNVLLGLVRTVCCLKVLRISTPGTAFYRPSTQQENDERNEEKNDHHR